MESSLTSEHANLTDAIRLTRIAATSRDGLTPICEIVKDVLDQYEVMKYTASVIRNPAIRRSALAGLKKDVDDFARAIERDT